MFKFVQFWPLILWYCGLSPLQAVGLANMQTKYVNVFDAEGARWKRLRTLSAPYFTAKSMKQVGLSFQLLPE